jgi:hypothetical protein
VREYGASEYKVIPASAFVASDGSAITTFNGYISTEDIDTLEYFTVQIDRRVESVEFEMMDLLRQASPGGMVTDPTTVEYCTANLGVTCYSCEGESCGIVMNEIEFYVLYP